MEKSNQFFVLTGGPCSGKTTLLDALASRGYAVMPEAGRHIIQDQVAIGGGALPWLNPLAFAELMLSWELRSYHEASSKTAVVIFDRGIPDIWGYLQLNKVAVPAHIKLAAQLYSYNPQVFILPPWPEIFEQDAERKQSLEEAEATYQAMVKVYTELGYKLVSLPKVSVGERVSHVINQVKALT